ncbi:MAG: hypothetical protein US96_C0009G0006 [Candidatus Woesebacteria bacterium GW2011_GWB1_38_5b]|uniref:Uncharacterized protein n=1 Tax=Candidatus Woesebacteria bacterium GW2011_GWB1_38_5b TaxID=1618569 RepID=A0A0G0K789_9BACT|nr:MAG: hypothetical protein US96_C0009G0006 [Candidatus Woesebacteria bacterium GW2011_GWB1_38_5b]OGH48173.1 MAG: hypothetical protein A3A51_04070 [Candidatus Levybacteria bacterium RIFCSPLOWO2_01_FULL_39_10]
MQNKFAVVGIAIAAVLIVGGFGLYLLNNNQSSQTDQTETTNTSGSENMTAGKTISDLLKSGESTQCNFNYTDEGGSTAGVVYIDQDRMRGDITTVVDETEQEINIIRKENINYIWGSAFPDNSGLMFESKVEDIETNEQYRQYFDSEKKIDYSCGSWTVDESAFNPPTDVEFNDLPGMVGEAIKEELGDSACSVCDSLTGEAQTACRANLNCQ